MCSTSGLSASNRISSAPAAHDRVGRTGDRHAFESGPAVVVCESGGDPLAGDALVVVDLDVDALGDLELGRIPALLVQLALDRLHLISERRGRLRSGSEEPVANSHRALER